MASSCASDLSRSLGCHGSKWPCNTETAQSLRNSGSCVSSPVSVKSIQGFLESQPHLRDYRLFAFWEFGDIYDQLRIATIRFEFRPDPLGVAPLQQGFQNRHSLDQ